MSSKLCLFSSTKKLSPINIIIRNCPGQGVGKGGGGGGSIRDAGGAFGEMGAVHEEEYFYRKQKELIEQLREKIKYHKKELHKYEGELKEGEENL